MLADGIRPQLIVILSDINMPGMDGLSLLREAKKSRRRRSSYRRISFARVRRRRISTP